MKPLTITSSYEQYYELCLRQLVDKIFIKNFLRFSFNHSFLNYTIMKLISAFLLMLFVSGENFKHLRLDDQSILFHMQVCLGKPSENLNKEGGCAEPAVTLSSSIAHHSFDWFDARIVLEWSSGVTPQMVSASMVVMNKRTVPRAKYVLWQTICANVRL